MRSVFSRSRRAAAACLLIVTLLVPNAWASDSGSGTSLWDEFVVWAAMQLAPADDAGFTMWLLGRIGVPGG